MPKYLLGIDNGGTVIKAGLYDLEGQELAITSSKIKMTMPKPGYVERDANELWEANIQAIAAVIRQSGVNPKDIAGLATTGHGNGLYLVDAQGMPVCPGIYSSDMRAQEYVNTWYADGTFDRVLPKTLQSIWAGQPVALLAWLRDHQPEVFLKARWAFMCKDYLRYRLTGEAYAEITDMSGTSMLNVRDVKYDRELLQTFGIEAYADLFPPLKYSAEICGYVTEAVAAKTGLQAGTPVAGGLFDIDACGIATGMTTDEKFSLVVGTWSINQYISQTPLVSKSIFMTSLYCMPGYWLVTEASPTSASNLEWFITELLGEAQAIADAKGSSIYNACNEWVAQVAPEDSQVIFLPFLYGTNVETDAKACFLGVKGWHHRAHLLRAIYEGVVFSHQTHIEKLLAFRKLPKVIRLTGGAARSKVWVQMFADVLQIPIEITTGAELGTAGAAMCAEVATKQFASFEAAAAKMVNVAQTYTPDPAKKDVYAKKYAAYRQAIATLAPLWKQL